MSRGAAMGPTVTVTNQGSVVRHTLTCECVCESLSPECVIGVPGHVPEEWTHARGEAWP